MGNTYGGVSGGYSYVDANGELQQVQYVADGAEFGVADSRLPMAPTFNPEPLVAPVYIIVYSYVILIMSQQCFQSLYIFNNKRFRKINQKLKQ